MKKLLVLSLVLGMVSLASAGFSITGYDGQVLKESDTIILGVGATVDQLADAGLIVGVADGAGSLALGQTPYNNVNADVFFDLDAEMAGMFGLTSASFFDGVALEVPIPTAPADVAGGVLFHCDGPGDVLVLLLDLDTGEVYDSITIAQVPEPATMVLLGLGGLFLRRKK